ncbi:CCN family member 1-like [Mastacembelus armatus]|uniref:CCN family member 1 n=1 Tax=Mastacembelus armatus TaxID=205130 RepID=A0A3Q3N0X4_9TELE|nr:CCN family member 1-like [Mastacembelus armatus]
MWKVCVIVVLRVMLVSASCPEHCLCPPEVPRCGLGISLILDSCGCCNVCARQLFEDCSKTQPCDHKKGLECNFGGRFGSAKGICRAKSDGRTCEYNNKIYQNGEIFHPNCKHQCTCMDGAVGCVSLCPHELSLSKLGCVKPGQVKSRRQCCVQPACPKDTKSESSVEKKQSKKHSKDRASKDDFSNTNEWAPVWKGKSKSLPAFRRHLVARGDKCVSQTTAWSPCSKSCGTGVSTRMTNSNTQCRLVTEMRICTVRPCHQKTFSRMMKGKKCNHLEKTSHPIKLSYSGCRSLKKFQPKYCGLCSDGQCCRPHRTQTTRVLFRCKNGEIMNRMLMMIESCKCDHNCVGGNKKTPNFHRLFDDKHKLNM